MKYIALVVALIYIIGTWATISACYDAEGWRAGVQTLAPRPPLYCPFLCSYIHVHCLKAVCFCS